MLEGCRTLAGAPTLLTQENFFGWPHSNPPKPAGAQSSPSPPPSPSPPSPSSPSCPQNPSPEEKSGAFFRASSSLSVSSFSAICLRKKNHPATRAIHRKPIQSSHASTPFLPAAMGGVSLMRRDRPFRGRLPGGPDIGLPAVPASLSERVPVVPQIPLRRNSSTDKAEMFLERRESPDFLSPVFPNHPGSEKEKEEEQDGKNGHGIPKRRTWEFSLFDTCVQGQ